MCWADLHELETSFEEECKKYTGKNIPSGNGRTKWLYNLGLIKLILKYNKRNKYKTKPQRVDKTIHHSIVNRGREYKDMGCSVCCYLQREETKLHVGTQNDE